MAKRKNVFAGVAAGVVGGLAAAWMLNEFLAGLAPAEPLNHEQKEETGPLVHYAVGALTGGIYGGLAEYSPVVRSGFGTSFGGVLFSTADLLDVPAFGMGPSLAGQPTSAQAKPFAAHIVYGVTTELVRRLVRLFL